MKKQFIYAAAFMLSLGIFSATNTMAQSTNDKVWSIGPEVGVNFSKIGQDGSDSDFTTGLLGGVNLTYSVRNTYGFTGKVLYSQKGYEFENNKVRLDYIEVPVVARVFFNREGAFRPNVFAGPSFGFLTGARAKIGDGDAEKIDHYDDIYNAFDFGLTGGLGFNYEFAPETRLLIDARYTHGLTDISKDSGAEANNQAIGVTVGVSFGL